MVDYMAVSVVILTYGNFDGLERTINSVLAQDISIKTLMVSDDGSGRAFPQEVVKRLNEFHGRYKRLIFRQNETNLGTVAHMNLTAALCGDEYVKFLASGDAFYTTQSLGELMAFAQEKGTLVVTASSVVSSPDLAQEYYLFPGHRRGDMLNLKRDRQYPILVRENLVSAAATLFRSEFFSEHGGFDQTYHLLEDWPTWLRLTREGETIPYLHKVVCRYALGGLSSQNSNAFSAPALRADMLLCYEKEILPYFGRLGFGEKYRARYGYACLSGAENRTLWRNYFPLELKSALKRCIKQYLVKRESYGSRN